LPLTVQIMQIATDADLLFRLSTTDEAVAILQYGAGRSYDPALAAHFCRAAPQLIQFLRADSVWHAVIALAPPPASTLSSAELEEALQAIAEWTDLQSPGTEGHAAAVAVLATAAGQRYGLPIGDIALLGQAALVHDIGMVGISPAILALPGPLSDDDRESIRMHVYDTERIFARSRALSPIAALAALHHERLDGSGYYRGLGAAQISPAARILSAADVYQSLIEPRPYRAALAPAAAAEELHREARAGRLESDAVRAVLAAAGHRLSSGRHTGVAGLSVREIEVLRLLARGWSNRRMAEHLIISERTVDHHIRHIYDKIDVSTRAAAALFAMQHHLLAPGGE
jgi:response regulator RpfG family c-di-GMP phosphodiesterase/DNA-binding CsgD family transcriptional regulator